MGGEQQRQRSSGAAAVALGWRSLFKWRRSSKLEWGWNPGARGSARGSASEASLLPCAATKEVANVLVEMDSNVVQDRQDCSVCRQDLWLCPEELELSLPAESWPSPPPPSPPLQALQPPPAFLPVRGVRRFPLASSSTHVHVDQLKLVTVVAPDDAVNRFQAVPVRPIADSCLNRLLP